MISTASHSEIYRLRRLQAVWGSNLMKFCCGLNGPEFSASKFTDPSRADAYLDRTDY